MKHYIVFFLLTLFPLRVAAQEMITGYAIDDVTGDSLGFVTVQYKGQKVNTVCDHRGYFSIPKHVGWKLLRQISCTKRHNPAYMNHFRRAFKTFLSLLLLSFPAGALSEDNQQATLT